MKYTDLTVQVVFDLICIILYFLTSCTWCEIGCAKLCTVFVFTFFFFNVFFHWIVSIYRVTHKGNGLNDDSKNSLITGNQRCFGIYLLYADCKRSLASPLIHLGKVLLKSLESSAGTPYTGSPKKHDAWKKTWGILKRIKSPEIKTNLCEKLVWSDASWMLLNPLTEA